MSAHNGTPPYSNDDEMAILGCALLGPSIMPKLVEGTGLSHPLKPRHFYRQSHGAIFEAMMSIWERGHDPDALLVEGELIRRGDGSAKRLVGVLSYSIPGPASHWPQYAQTVIDLAQLRAVARLCQRTIDAIHAQDREALNVNFDRLTDLGLPASWKVERPDNVRTLRRSA